MSDSQRRHYKIKSIVVNGIRIKEVIIDPHYEVKHSKSINDELILRLVNELDGRIEAPDIKKGKYSYFATLVNLGRKSYRLIWLIEDHALYIGVVNTYRDERNK